MSAPLPLPEPCTPAVRRVLDLDPAALAVALSLLAGDHELVVAARLALDVRDGRRALREAALDVHGAQTPTEWRRWAEQRIPFDELQRRRGLVRNPTGAGWRTVRCSDAVAEVAR